MNLAQWQKECGSKALRFFSLGRHALVEALRAAGIKTGDKVLLPEFICRDVLASLHAVGAEAVWYSVSENLGPASSSEAWPQARAVLAVNYFGFSQELAPFRAYAARTNAIIIEDNAHGFLSRDETGQWLGTRGDAGLFSIRKSLCIADGAALSVNNANIARSVAAQLIPKGKGYHPQTVWKGRLRALRMIGTAAAAAMTSSVRHVRRLRTGHAILPPDAKAEHTIPHPPQPYSGLMDALSALDVDGEVDRRRGLYRDAEKAARNSDIAPLFPTLPGLVAPYGFPFRSEPGRAVERLRQWTGRQGLELISWPDLPQSIEHRLPPHHRTVWLVNFL